MRSGTCTDESSLASREDLLDRLRARLPARYQDLQFLASGGMGCLFKARHREQGRAVVVKVPRFSADGRPEREVRQRFLREARIIASMSHPFIVEVLEVLEGEPLPCFVMEFLEGETLEARLQASRPGSIRESLLRGIDLCDALIHIHRRDVIHRDLKPANVILLVDGGLKLIDFGLSKSPREVTSVTGVGQVLGTMVYMAPEQMRGEEATSSSDLYALGAILYHMVTGRPPFSRETSVLKLERNPDPASRFRAGVPPRLDRILIRALSRDLAERQSSVLDLRSQLSECLDEDFPRQEPGPVEASPGHAGEAERGRLSEGSHTPDAIPLEKGTIREILVLRFESPVLDPLPGSPPQRPSSRWLCSLAEGIPRSGGQVRLRRAGTGLVRKPGPVRP